MIFSWKSEAGHLECRCREEAREPGQRVQYNPTWTQQASDVPSGYLEPLTDFASHSPFGGAFWFQPDLADRDSF